jgi:hypothetical protein
MDKGGGSMAVEEEQQVTGGHWCGECKRWWGHEECGDTRHYPNQISQPCNECSPAGYQHSGFYFEEDELTTFVRGVRKAANV